MHAERTTSTTPSASPVRIVAIVTFVLGLVLAIVLAYLEAHYDIRPRWIFGEVIAGVLISVVPVSAVARARAIQTWQEYERMIATAFVASGFPIIVWQLVTYWPR